MQIDIKYFGLATPSLPLTLEAAEGATVEDLLFRITASVKDPMEELRQRATFLVNGSRATLATELKDRDSLLILHVLGGG